MELDSGLQALTINMIRDSSLEELEVTVNELIMTGTSRPDLFDLLMGWFNEQIKRDAFAQNESLLPGFIRLLHMNNHADIEPFNLLQVDEALNQWIQTDASQDSAYRRRYLIIQQDINRHFEEGMWHSQEPGTLSSTQYRYKQGKGDAPYLGYTREDSDMRTEGDEYDRPGDTHHNTLLDFASSSRILEKDNSTEIDEPDLCDDSSTIEDILPKRLDDMMIITDEAAQTASSTDKQARKYSTPSGQKPPKYRVPRYFSGLPPVPPEDYICRRCKKSGHWIQRCPTNLDPTYDVAPPPTYRCGICKKKGHHFATLCPLNPHEESLARQREHAHSGLPEDKKRHSFGQGSSARHSRGRSGPRGPKRRSRDHYRSRSPKDRRPQKDDEETCSPRFRDRDNDEFWHGDQSPYTARARLTGELQPSTERNVVDRPSRQSVGSSGYRHRSVTPPARRSRSPPMNRKQQRQRRRALNQVTRSIDEGRLAYDDETDQSVGSKPPSYLSTHHPSDDVTGIGSGSGEVVVSASSSKNKYSEEYNKAEREADDFLRELAAEIMSKAEGDSQAKEINRHGVILGAGGSSMDHSAARTIPSLGDQSVRRPQISPEVASLFGTQNIPPIKARPKRKTASEMMDALEDSETHPSVQSPVQSHLPDVTEEHDMVID
ncbi:hypothetical protein F4777DRAFT_258734 [Nemania sp. FL0916]|nr:hypothetical protein F4777DRAFT_258734 [Nemania sp. FL0916]